MSRVGVGNARVSNPMNVSIPVYNADGSLFACASEQRLERLKSAGLVDRLIRSRKGQIMRAILFLRPDEPKPTSANSPPCRYQIHSQRASGARAGSQGQSLLTFLLTTEI
jgi:hypothetical protein